MMKHFNMKSWMVALMAIGAFTACEPIEDSYDYDTSEMSADQLQITATAKVINGVNSNEIVVENHSPIPSQWTISQMGTTDKMSSKSCDVLLATKTGTNEIKFRGFNALSNTYVEKTLTVQVDAITEVPSYIAERLCIGQSGAPATFGTELDYTKIQVVVEKDANGQNGNRVTLINPNPVLTTWEFGGETADKNIAELYVLNLGETPLKATFTLADGKTVSHEFEPVKVETFTYKPEFLVNLTGGDKGEGTWTWIAAPAPAYGLGGYMMSTQPEWASFDFATLGGLAYAVGKGTEGEGATMTFKLTGELVLSSGRQGTWSFDLSKGVPGWSIGKLYTHGVSVLYGQTFDQTTYIGPEAFEYDIVECGNGKLMLCAPCAGVNYPSGMGTFFCFMSVE